MAAAAMDAALASLRSAMESLLEEKLTAALAEMEALRTETIRLKVEQQALATETSELRIENQVLQGELKEIRLRLGGVEAASTAPRIVPSGRESKLAKFGEKFGGSRKGIHSLALVAAKGLVRGCRAAGPGPGGRKSPDGLRPDRVEGSTGVTGGRSQQRNGGSVGELEAEQLR